MARITLESFQHFHSIIEGRYPSTKAVIYRGVKDARYKLIPKVGRVPGYTLTLEKDILWLFKRYATPFVGYEPKTNWEWLAIAQHHGLPTRLLDWTENPLVAAYFAVEQSIETDGAIYVMRAPLIVDTDREREPLKRSTGVDVFINRPVTPRIAAQAGVFTVHWKPKEPINRNTIDKLIIPSSLHRPFKDMLFRYGVHRGTLFPDLDGQARFIEWLTTEK
jgi:hypothetical protein